MKKLHDYFCSGYTLIELLIAVSLSLLLLLGVTEMFRHVGSTMSDTQKSLNMAANLNATAMTLRSDLSKIDPDLAHKPSEMAAGNTVTDDGYLEITEGMNAPYSEVVTNHNGLHVPISQVAFSPDTPYDQTVGDVDDILAFTATTTEAGYPFRGLINNTMPTVLPSFAEIIWFVRGTTLYRRVLLYDEYNAHSDRNTLDQTQQSFYARNDLSVHLDGTTIKANTMQELSRRENRFAHSGGTFPFPLYNNSNEAWYYLRMPTLEETVSTIRTWTPGQALPTYAAPTNITPVPYWDFWQNPNGLKNTTGSPTWELDFDSGSLSDYVDTDTTTSGIQPHPRNSRAGEDIVLKNVISFDVKVWNPYWVPCTVSETTYWAPPQYVDLGQDQLPCIDGIIRPVDYTHNLSGSPGPAGYGFTLKGRYNTAPDTTNTRRTYTVVGTYPDGDEWHKKERLHNGTAINQLYSYSPTSPAMPCVFDSWTFQYQSSYTSDSNYALGEPSTWRYPPPYTEDLQSLQITIRCFEPQSGNIKQVRVVQSF